MYVYQFCEIAQMVQMHSHGLMEFFGTVKRAYVYLITTAKDFVLSVLAWIRQKFMGVKEVLHNYFIKSEEELTK